MLKRQWNEMGFKHVALSVATFVFAYIHASSASALTLAQNFSFDGVLVNDSTGVPVTGPVPIQFQIYNPAGDCLVFEESHASVAIASDGSFNVKIGSGTRASAGVDGGLTLATIFQNNALLRAAASSGCTPGYTPAAGDGRKLRVTVSGTALTPDYSVSPMPMATVAETLQGKTPTDFVSATAASSTTGPLTIANQGELRLAELGSNGVDYVSLKAASSMAAPISFTLPGTVGTAGYVLSTDGSAGVLSWVAAGGGGSPTGAASGDLSGSYPSPTLSTTGVTAGTYQSLTVDAKGRVTAGTALTNALLAPISFTGDVVGSVSALSVQKIRGYTVSPATPTDGYALVYNAASPAWEPQLLPNFSAGGVMSGNLNITSGGLTTGTGNVGIGTMSPIEKLEVVGNIAASGSVRPSGGSAVSPGLNFGGSGSGLYYDGADVGVSIGASSKMVLKPSGRVGIGTTAPIQLLEVKADSGALPTVVQVTNGASGTGSKAMLTATNDLGFNANFGIASSTMTANGAIQSGDAFVSTTNSFLTLQSTGSGKGIRFGTGTAPATERMRITDTGNVGIGTTAPVATLDVAGTLRLAKNGSQPVACTAPYDGTLALTMNNTMCMCNGSMWVKIIDGTTSCVWP